ncbi:MAG: hypothetical protein PHT59_00680 [Candidatus Omnitrophica bacterium]|nr:hypothetical protein [Candidatus Omnitrophota bacterium]
MAEIVPGQQTQQTASPAGKAKTGTAKSAPAFGVQAVFRVFTDERNQLDIKSINRILYAVLALSVVNYVRLVSVWAYQVKTIDLQRQTSVDASAAMASVKEKQALRPLAAYLDKVKERNIFRMGRLVREPQGSVSTKAQEATASLRLVGISWSQNPDAMIEDTKVQKTYFVKKGQLVADMKVEAIHKDKVVLRLGQELIELR